MGRLALRPGLRAYAHAPAAAPVPTFVSTKSYAFDGVDEYILITGLAAPSIVTVSAWVKYDAGAYNGSCLGTGDNSPVVGNPAYNLMLWASGSDDYFGFNTWNSDSWGYGPAKSDMQGNWRWVVAEFHDGALASSKLWVAGVAKTLTQQKGTSVNRDIETQWGLGNRGGTGSGAENFMFPGNIDEVAIFDGVLTTGQREELANASYNKPAGPIEDHSLWATKVLFAARMGESDTDSGSVLEDLKGSNDGTCYNMVSGNIEEEAP